MSLTEEEALKLKPGTKLKCVDIPDSWKKNIANGEVHTFQKAWKGCDGSIYIVLEGQEDVSYFPHRFELVEEQIESENGSEWNTECPVCQSPAYQGLGPITCSRGCKL